MTQSADDDPRLQGWKAIAAFLGKTERTAKRWERQHGLPIHRVDDQTNASVYAYRSELQDWLRRPARPTTQQPDGPDRLRAAPWRSAGAGISILSGLVLGAILGGAADTATISSGLPASPPAIEIKSETAKARDLLLSGVYQLALRTPHSLERAKHDFRQAIRLDGKSDEALAWLAKTYAVIGEAAQPAQAGDAFTLARYWADKALDRNSRNAEALAASGIVALYGDRNVAAASQLLERALAIAPNSAAANHWYAVARMYEGDFDIALRYILKAQNLSPRSPAIRASKGRILALLGRAHDAKRELTDLIESAPEFATPYRYLAGLDLDEGRFPQFLENLEAVARIRRDTRLAAKISAAQSGAQKAGSEVLATKIPELFGGQGRRKSNHAYLQARIAALQGDSDAALSYLEHALAGREQAILAIKIDPAFREFRNSDRFITIVRRLGLSPIEPVLANTDAIDSSTN